MIFHIINDYFQPQLVQKYSYDVEIHHVITEDGYILELHRITGSPNIQSSRKKYPVLLMHGLLGCSATWVVMRPLHALGASHHWHQSNK